MNLFLDDERWPMMVEWVNFDYTSINWVIVRNYDDFVEAVSQETIDLVSFDHDLDRSSTFECVRCNCQEVDFDYSRVKEKTGLDCAKFLLNFCKDNGKKVPPYLIHSLNHKGRKNIEDVLGLESLIGTYKKDLIIQKADEILERRSKRF